LLTRLPCSEEKKKSNDIMVIRCNVTRAKRSLRKCRRASRKSKESRKVLRNGRGHFQGAGVRDGPGLDKKKKKK